jgi:hypothetical protein
MNLAAPREIVPPPIGGLTGPMGVAATYDIRRLEPAAAAMLERFHGSPLVANGQINLLSLDAIAERLGSKWAMRRQPVYDYIDRLLERHVGANGHFMRVSETDFLIVLPDEPKLSAQLRCLRCLREVLMHFLGEARSSDIRVREVTRITSDGLDAVLVDPAAISSAEAQVKPPDPEIETPKTGVDRWTPFTASNGRRARVSCVLEPVFELKTYSRIGNRIARRVLCADTGEPFSAAELARLSRSDIEKIDLATIARGLDRLRSDAGGDRQLSLIIPVSYLSLSSRQGRAAVAGMFAEAKTFVRAGIICEVCDIESVPQTALLEATSLIKPYCVLLIGRLAAAPDHRLGNLRGAGLQAISFEAADQIVEDSEFLKWAKPAVGAAKLIAKAVVIYRLGSPRQAGLMALLGASHASLRPRAPSEPELGAGSIALAASRSSSTASA